MNLLSKITRQTVRGHPTTRITIPKGYADLIPDQATHMAVEYCEGSFIFRPVAFSPMEEKENV